MLEVKINHLGPCGHCGADKWEEDLNQQVPNYFMMAEMEDGSVSLGNDSGDVVNSTVKVFWCRECGKEERFRHQPSEAKDRHIKWRTAKIKKARLDRLNAEMALKLNG